jgi:hypothetical protein
LQGGAVAIGRGGGKTLAAGEQAAGNATSFPLTDVAPRLKQQSRKRLRGEGEEDEGVAASSGGCEASDAECVLAYLVAI